MPGPVSDSYRGPGLTTPYVPSWCYPGGAPRMCACGDHEGFHDDSGVCLLRAHCKCPGLSVSTVPAATDAGKDGGT